jgi:hypothetical protein
MCFVSSLLALLNFLIRSSEAHTVILKIMSRTCNRNNYYLREKLYSRFHSKNAENILLCKINI